MVIYLLLYLSKTLSRKEGLLSLIIDFINERIPPEQMMRINMIKSSIIFNKIST